MEEDHHQDLKDHYQCLYLHFLEAEEEEAEEEAEQQHLYLSLLDHPPKEV